MHGLQVYPVVRTPEIRFLESYQPFIACLSVSPAPRKQLHRIESGEPQIGILPCLINNNKFIRCPYYIGNAKVLRIGIEKYLGAVNAGTLVCKIPYELFPLLQHIGCTHTRIQSGPFAALWYENDTHLRSVLSCKHRDLVYTPLPCGTGHLLGIRVWHIDRIYSNAVPVKHTYPFLHQPQVTCY